MIVNASENDDAHFLFHEEDSDICRNGNFTHGDVSEERRFTNTVPTNDTVAATVCKRKRCAGTRSDSFSINYQKNIESVTHRIRFEPKLTSIDERWTSFDLFLDAAAASNGLIFINSSSYVCYKTTGINRYATISY